MDSRVLNFATSIEKLEKRLLQTNSIDTAIALIMRYWQAYRFSTIDSEAIGYLQRANHLAITTHRKNTVHIHLYCLTIFTAIESGHFDMANEMLDRVLVYKYKSFLRTNEKFAYAVLCFLYAYLEIQQGRRQSAKSHWDAFIAHIKTDAESPYYLAMLGILYYASQEYDEAYRHFKRAYLRGGDSIFLYESFYRFYRNAPQNITRVGEEILPILIYIASRGGDITSIATKYQDELRRATENNYRGVEYLYAISGYHSLLREICSRRMRTDIGNISVESFKFYKEAESKQVYVPGLYQALIQAAYANKAEYINYYPLKEYLNSTLLSNDDLSIYVYHLLLNNNNLVDIVENHSARILTVTTRALETGKRGRWVNSLYYYRWKKNQLLGTVESSELEDILHENLTLFELSASKGDDMPLRHVYIIEPERRGMTVYNVAENETSIVVTAGSDNVVYTCLGAGQRAVLDEKLTVRRMLPGVGIDLYLYFFKKGSTNFYVLVYLCNHFLSIEEYSDEDIEEAILVFEKMLEEKNITKAYKMRVLVALGGLYYSKNKLDLALKCYGNIDEDALGHDYIEQILNVYLQTLESGRAINLLAKKHRYVSGQTMLDSVLTLLKQPVDHTPLAEVAYKLLVNGFYDTGMLTLVLEHFKGTYAEWKALATTMEKESLDDLRLDAKIITTAIFMAEWDLDIQRSFMRIYIAYADSIKKATPSLSDLPTSAKTLILDFVDYATYEMVTNYYAPEYDVLDVLENMCLTDKDAVFLAWGLASVYLKHDISTMNSNKILKMAFEAQEQRGLILPIFKEKKTSRVPYIEKHQTFVYRGLPNKDCWLYYKIDNATTYTAIPMQYVRYGMYIAVVPMFYNEEIIYYFSEEMTSGSITTHESSFKNNILFLHENPDDSFFAINNATIYAMQFKHEQAEQIISNLVKDVQTIRSGLL